MDAEGYMRAGINAQTNAVADTLYYGRFEMTPNQRYLVHLSVVDTDNLTEAHFLGTADVTTESTFFSGPSEGYRIVLLDKYPHARLCPWTPYVVFNPNIGLPSIDLRCQLPTVDRRAVLIIDMQTSVYTISAFLRSLLTGEKERLFLFFRDPAGAMIAASHGKYFSHSDIDFSKVNFWTYFQPTAHS